MPRRESCPNCGSKKIIIERDRTKKCQICGYTWLRKPKRRTPRKEKTRF